MAKIQNDAYFTPDNIVKFGWHLIEKYIGLENITEVIESSAGAGAWLRQDLEVPFLSYDIAPQNDLVETADFLTLPLVYKKGRLIGFNPPFGRSNYLSKKFFKKAIGVADYIVFVQPITQLDNPVSMYEFDLIASVDLGLQHYTDRDLHCCLNIWKRPENGLNKQPTFDIEGLDVQVIKTVKGERVDTPRFDKPDIRINGWGTRCGRVLGDNDRTYAYEVWIKCNEDIKEKILSIDWLDFMNGKATAQNGTKHVGKTMMPWMLKKKVKEEFFNDKNK